MSKIEIYDKSFLDYTVREDGDFLELDFVVDDLILEKIIMPRSIALILAQNIYKDFYIGE